VFDEQYSTLLAPPVKQLEKEKTIDDLPGDLLGQTRKRAEDLPVVFEALFKNANVERLALVGFGDRGPDCRQPGIAFTEV
jgi:hypothetical protein